jgi:dTMP kinase
MIEDPRPASGLFLCFEGGDGSGKSTQRDRLYTALKAAGHEVVATREPGGSPSAERIRDILLRGDLGALDPRSELLLFTAARVEHLRSTVLPALARGAVVLCDRFLDSSLAYQGAGNGTDSALILELHRTFCGDIRPDLTFLLDGPSEALLARSKARLAAEGSGEDRYENAALDFHQRLSARYRALAAAEPDRYVVLDATQPIDRITAAMLAAVRARGLRAGAHAA